MSRSFVDQSALCLPLLATRLAGRSASTREGYLCDVRRVAETLEQTSGRAAGAADILELDTSALQRLVDVWEQDGVSAATIRRRLVSLRTHARHLARELRTGGAIICRRVRMLDTVTAISAASCLKEPTGSGQGFAVAAEAAEFSGMVVSSVRCAYVRGGRRPMRVPGSVPGAVSVRKDGRSASSNVSTATGSAAGAGTAGFIPKPVNPELAAAFFSTGAVCAEACGLAGMKGLNTGDILE